jgi:hypothetical protein
MARQVNVRVLPTTMAIEESVVLASEIYNRVLCNLLSSIDEFRHIITPRPPA